MARIRSLKPEFFRSKSLARCSFGARLTFQGLWCEADDYGRGEAEPRVLAGVIWPLDDDIGWEEVEGHLVELVREKRIVLYEVDGDRYYEIPSWEEHQAAAYRRGKAQHPAPTPDTPEQESHDQSCKEVQAAPPMVLEGNWELGTGNEELGTRIATTSAARRQDPIWDAIVECWGIDQGEISTTERGRLNKACADFRSANADPGEIPARRGEFRRRYPHATDTPIAVAGRWAELNPANRNAVGGADDLLGAARAAVRA